MPKVSVIIPNYNHAKFLPARIQSVLDQTFQDFEIIFLDDRSTDDSLAVVQPFLSNPRIRAILNDVNSGSSFAQWDKGMAACTGEYVWIAESDDKADPRLLERLVAALDASPSVGVAYCQSHQIDENDRILRTMEWWTAPLDPMRWSRDFTNSGKDECARYVIDRCTIPNASAALIRKSVYAAAGSPDRTMRLCGDWKFWAQVLLVSDVAFVAEPLNYFRAHTGTVRGNSKKAARLREAYAVRSFIADRIDVPARELAVARGKMCEDWITYTRQGLLTFKEQVEVYRVGRGFDPFLLPRLVSTFVKRVAGGATKRFKGIARLRTA